MGFIKDIREKLNHRLIKQASSRHKRIKRFVNYAGVTTVGILYDASSETQYRALTNFVKELHNDQKKVRTIGFVNLKKMPDYCFPKLFFEFCNSRHFRWNLTGITPIVKDFASADFDVLIDLTPPGFYQIKYIVAESPAHFKVGRYFEKYIELYDLMLTVNHQAPHDEVIKHIHFYLKLINNNDQGEEQHI